MVQASLFVSKSSHKLWDEVNLWTDSIPEKKMYIPDQDQKEGGAEAGIMKAWQKLWKTWWSDQAGKGQKQDWSGFLCIKVYKKPDLWSGWYRIRLCGKSANGAGDENRTHVVSLEGWSSTIELHLQKNGDSAGIRTLDPLIKSQVLYQLSYRVRNGAD